MNRVNLSMDHYNLRALLPSDLESLKNKWE